MTVCNADFYDSRSPLLLTNLTAQWHADDILLHFVFTFHGTSSWDNFQNKIGPNVIRLTSFWTAVVPMSLIIKAARAFVNRTCMMHNRPKMSQIWNSIWGLSGRMYNTLRLGTFITVYLDLTAMYHHWGCCSQLLVLICSVQLLEIVVSYDFKVLIIS